MDAAGIDLHLLGEEAAVSKLLNRLRPFCLFLEIRTIDGKLEST